MSLTFTKLFSSITESTIWCEDSDTRIVWITMLAMADRQGRVWGSIPGIANRARVGVETARAAIGKFLSPDADSRSETAEGRRLEVIDGGWRLINYAKYRAIRDEEQRKAYKAEHEAKRRAAKRGQNGQTWTGNGHKAEAEADTDKPLDQKHVLTAFARPSREQVREYSKQRKSAVDPEGFCDFYDSNGWKVSRNPMKDWKATFRNWERRNGNVEGSNPNRGECELHQGQGRTLQGNCWGCYAAKHSADTTVQADHHDRGG